MPTTLSIRLLLLNTYFKSLPLSPTNVVSIYVWFFWLLHVKSNPQFDDLSCLLFTLHVIIIIIEVLALILYYWVQKKKSMFCNVVKCDLILDLMLNIFLIIFNFINACVMC